MKEMIKNNDIDGLISAAKHTDRSEAKAALAEYEKYYSHEAAIAHAIQDILVRVKVRRTRRKIPIVGNYTYKLE